MSSSSSSPATQFSQIAHKFKRPDKESLKAWRASDEIKEAILAKEKDIEDQDINVRLAKGLVAHIEGQIHDKQTWIKNANAEIRKSEQWIRSAEDALSEKEREMRAEVLEMNNKSAWIESKKKMFPYEFPEYQFVDED